MDVWCYKDGRNRGTTKMGEISNNLVQERRLKLHGRQITRRDEEYVGKRVMGVDIEGGRVKRLGQTLGIRVLWTMVTWDIDIGEKHAAATFPIPGYRDLRT